jgi:DNA-binding Lrp family transcriptional regulator
MPLIEAIQTEIARRQQQRTLLDEQISQLREMHWIATKLSSSEPRPAAPPPERRLYEVSSGVADDAAATRADGLSAKQQCILEIIHRRAPIAVGQIARELGSSPGAVSAMVRQLAARGLVVGEGATVRRTYRAVGQDSQRQRTEQGKQRVARAESDRLRAITLRERVLKAIAAEPEALSEKRLTEVLGVEREEIADACGRLLLDDKIDLKPDGTYRRNASSA